MNNDINCPLLLTVGIDAVPRTSQPIVNRNIIDCKFSADTLVDRMSEEDFKSAFFLLMDKVGPKNFLIISCSPLPLMKNVFINICRTIPDKSMFIELFGTMKMYKKLKLFDTCYHIYESKRNTLNQISKIWKVLYLLCEELTDEDVDFLKQSVPESFRNQILSAEQWFCWAFKENIFSKTDLSPLETIFKEYPNCLNIIRSFKDIEVYHMKEPSSSSHCGIALILNYEKFDENSKLDQRHYSDKDVDSLKELWKTFGFKTEDHTDLNRSKTFEVVENCASSDHSSFDAFVCCILSHGKLNAVYSFDGMLMEISELIKPFTECLTLQNKPKLFFIQACQGIHIHQGQCKPIFKVDKCKKCENPAEETTPAKEATPAQTDKLAPPPVVMDTLISISSIDGYVSFRDDRGSWFIQTLCKIMEEYGDTHSIQDVLTKVNNEISSKYSVNLGSSGPIKALQMPQYKSSLTKKLILKKCLKNT